MSNCKVCQKPHSKFHLHSKPVCLRCDELLFDLEIELELEGEEKNTPDLPTTQAPRVIKGALDGIKAKG